MDIAEIKDKAIEFRQKLDAKKLALAPQDFSWYPYGTLNSFYLFDSLLTGNNRLLLDLIGEHPTVDIGCADGDLAFFLETLGRQVQVVDYTPTNYNGLQGLKLLKNNLSSNVEIHEVDLDAQFVLPQKTYSLAFFLGILYHLKNPYYALEALAKAAKYCLISTRIARFNTDDAAIERPDVNRPLFQRTDISQLPVAYLLDEAEANNDSTNYWIFSEAGLRRILNRTGWEICDYMTVGNTVNSDPASAAGDERAFCLIRSRFHS